MRFVAMTLTDAYIVELDPVEDERGFFARTFDEEEFRQAGLPLKIAQCSLSFNPRRGTLRGMHYQAEPYSEAKLIRCTRGAIYDVLVDLRPGTPFQGKWEAVELTDENRRMAYAPEGFAHGFMTLTDNAEVFYQISHVYRPEFSRGVRWDDPALNINWPLVPSIISDRDRSFPDLRLE